MGQDAVMGVAAHCPRGRLVHQSFIHSSEERLLGRHIAGISVFMLDHMMTSALTSSVSSLNFVYHLG